VSSVGLQLVELDSQRLGVQGGEGAYACQVAARLPGVHDEAAADPLGETLMKVAAYDQLVLAAFGEGVHDPLISAMQQRGLKPARGELDEVSELEARWRAAQPVSSL